MGDKQLRADAAQAGAEVLKPQFDALGDLTVAQARAAEGDALVATAKVEAQRLIDAALNKRDQLLGNWRDSWQAAKTAGWSERQLQQPPIGLRSPPAVPRGRHPTRRRSATDPGPAVASGATGTPGGDDELPDRAIG
jgi:cell division septum initiation protein DivIVA